MGALSDLLNRPEGAAVSAVPAVLPSAAVAEPQEPQEPQGVAPENHARLLHLADDEGVDAAHVHRLHADDLVACEGLPDDALRAYLRALERSARMDAGLVPREWGEPVARACEGCGPVWLWSEAPDKVRACPWCFRRKAGKPIPRPPVNCGDCRHYAPDPLNPAAGVGTCGLGIAARWPMQPHPCEAMRPRPAASQSAEKCHVC
jgi:hypothetical protein